MESRPLPYSEEAEAGVLGAVLLEHEKVLDICVEKKMLVADFYVPAHKIIFETMGSLFAKHIPIDILTVGEQLKKDERLNVVGGIIFLERLIDKTPTATHAAHYIDEVKRKSLSRRIIKQCREGEAQAFSSDDPDELRSIIEAGFTKMDQKVSLKDLATVFEEIKHDVEAGIEGKPVERGIPTGFQCIDALSGGGMRDGQVYWLSGNEKTGKTSLKANIIVRQLIAGRKVGDITLEMPFRDELEKLMGIHLAQNIATAMQGGKTWIGPERMAETRKLLVESKRLHILDRQMVRTTTDFWSACRRLVYRHGVQLITLDYFQKLQVDGENKKSLEQKTTEKSQAVVDVASMLNIPILCVAAIESTHGKIRGSRMADYDGAAHWQLSRDEEKEPHAPDFSQEITVFTKASRYGVSFGSKKLQFSGLTGRFEEPNDKKEPEFGLDGPEEE